MTTSKANIELPERHSLDESLIIENGYNIVRANGDFSITWKTESPNIPRERTVLYQSEPPVSRGRLSLYADHKDFLGVFCYCPVKANEYRITNTAAYPYCPAYGLAAGGPVKPRNGSGIYFAGKCNSVLPDGPYFNGYRQYGFRQKVAGTLREAFGGVCVGHGWGTETKQNWQETKMNEISEMCPDYVLCFENCRIMNYASEKFTDGLLSGRLALYYGAPNIRFLLPGGVEESFVNLDDFVDIDVDTGEPFMNYIKLFVLLDKMSDAEYEQRVKNQYALADSLIGFHERQRRKVTERGLSLIEKYINLEKRISQ